MRLTTIEEEALLIVSRANPALPVYCRGVQDLASRIGAAAWAASLTPQQLALAMLDLQHPVQFAPDDPAQIILERHYYWALSQAQRRPGLIDIDSRDDEGDANGTAHRWARLLASAFPHLAEAAWLAWVLLNQPAPPLAVRGREKLYRLCQDAIETREAEVLPDITDEVDGNSVDNCGEHEDKNQTKKEIES